MIEDQQSYRDAFEMVLEQASDFELVARAGDAKTGIELCLSEEPDLVVCDYRLPDGGRGSQVAAALRDAWCLAPIVLLTGFLAPQVHREAERLSDVYVLSKDLSLQEIVDGMRRALVGSVPPVERVTSADFGLSERELEVLELLVLGHAPPTAASMLNLSVHTVRAATKSIYRKLEVNSQVEARAVALRLGAVVPPL